MSYAEDSDQLLLAYFRDFFRHVGQLERAICPNNGSAASRLGNDAGMPNNDTSSIGILEKNDSMLEQSRSALTTVTVREISRAAIQQNLLVFFEQQTRRAHNDGCQSYEEAKFVMAALADERFIKLDWVGKKEWINKLLESRLFHSHSAGEVFFQRADRILLERDPAQRELACVYLMALSLGFCGKFNQPQYAEKLAEYRRNLFAFVFHRSPGVGNLQHLFLEPYLYTLRGRKKRKLPRVKLWLAALCLLIAVYLGVSHTLWTSLVKPLNEMNGKISRMVGELNSKK